MGYSLALPIGFLCGFAPVILLFWLGPKYVHLTPLLWLLTFHLVLTMAILPLFSINIAFTQIRIPAVFTFILGVGHLVIAFGLPIITGLGVYGVALAGVLVIFVRHIIFIPWWGAKILKLPAFTFIPFIIPGCILTIGIFVSANLFNTLIQISNYIQLAAFIIIICCLTTPIIWFIGLNQEERKLIRIAFPLPV